MQAVSFCVVLPSYEHVWVVSFGIYLNDLYEKMVGENENMIYLCKHGIFPIMFLKMMMEMGTIVVGFLLCSIDKLVFVQAVENCCEPFRHV
jgi:hypothetical protein